MPIRWSRALVAVLLVEVILRAALHVEPVRRRLVPSPEGVGGEIAWAYAHARSPGFDAAFLAPDPELGWVGTSTGDRTTGRAADGRPDATRVLVLGDSFAWGLGVDADATFARRLEARRSDLVVLDLGVVGYGLDQAVLRLERDGAALRPDVVVLLGTETLALRAREAFVNYAKPWFSLDGALVLHGVPVPTPEVLRTRVLRVPATVQLGRLVVDRVERRARPGPGFGEHDPLVDALVDRWREDVVALGAVPLLLAVPTPTDQARDDAARGGALRQACIARDAVCADAWGELLARAPDPAAITEASSHWNEAGHALVAEVLDAALVRRGVAPP